MAESTTGHHAGPARHPRHHLPDTLHPTGPIPFLHPTKRYHPVLDTLKQPRLATRAHELPLPHPFIPTGHRPGVPTPPLHDQIYHVWKSRDNRKGRHRHVITGPGAKEYDTGRKSKVRKTAVGVSRMFTRFPVWDISYLVAVSFTIGKLPAPFVVPLNYLFATFFSAHPLFLPPFSNTAKVLNPTPLVPKHQSNPPPFKS